LKILLVERSERDALPIMQELKNCRFQTKVRRVATRKDLDSVLKSQDWDIVMAEDDLPKFSGLEVLEAVKNKKPGLPFIMISEKVDEEAVIEALKNGAQDFVMKDRLFRLCPAIGRALEYRKFELEKKNADKKLQRVAARFNLLSENITDVIWTMDKERKFTFISPSVTRILGIRTQDIIGLTLDELISSEEFQEIDKLLTEIISRRKKTKKHSDELKDIFEMEVRRKNRQPVWMESKVSIIYDEEKNPSGFLGVSRDITERKQKEKEIARLALAIEQIDEGLVLTDQEGIIQYVNDSFEKLISISRDKLIGQPLKMVKRKSVFEETDINILSRLPKENPWKGRLIRNKTDGSAYRADVSLYPMKDINGELTNYIYIERDITHEMKLQDKFVEMQKMEALGTLSGGIAHDFNNILMPIIVNSEMLLWDLNSGDPEHAYLTQILEAARRGKELVKQIVSYSRDSKVDKNTIDLVALIKESLNFLKASLPSTVKLGSEIRVNKGKIDGNPSQIQQVIMNLCTNAADALGVNGGTIKISLSRIEFKTKEMLPERKMKTGAYLCLSISDSGPGIDPAILDKIFDPFFSTKDPGKGSGMGLSVARKIIFDHKGTITIDNEPKKGATFHVYFPFSEESLSEDGEKSDYLQGGSERILLVDDEVLLVQSIKNMLQKMGYTVIGVTSSQKALDIFRSQPNDFNLVISDQTMPNLTGTQLAQEINRIRPSVPLVLMTGFSEACSPEESKKLGIDAYLNKPVSTEKLTTLIRRVLDQEKCKHGKNIDSR
jgi:PAS domain S-box-containing protein